jgi:cell pole-organizing protein PopZ
VKRILVVANQTLGGDQLLNLIRQRLAEDECEFWILVPDRPSGTVTHAGEMSLQHAEGSGASEQMPIASLEPSPEAKQRLMLAIDEIAAMGAGTHVDGEILHADPLPAIQDTVKHRNFDEIILSTLPPGISRWLHQDLLHRVDRKVDIQVTHVVATPST